MSTTYEVTNKDDPDAGSLVDSDSFVVALLG